MNNLTENFILFELVCNFLLALAVLGVAASLYGDLKDNIKKVIAIQEDRLNALDADLKALQKQGKVARIRHNRLTTYANRNVDHGQRNISQG
jgi:hypothetical protein